MSLAAMLLAIPAPASAADRVVARTAELTERPIDTGTGALRIASASVRQDRVADRAQATVTLDAAPDPGTDATLIVAFGPVRQGICELNDFLDADQYSTPVGETPAAGWTRDGATFRMDIADEAAGYQPWECAGAIMISGDQVVSFLGGDLTDILLKPELSIGRLEVLERPVKGKLKLVRGAQHTVRLPVSVTNEADAKDVSVTGAGKGLKVRGEKDDLLLGNNDSSFRLAVKATRKRVGPLKVKVTSSNGGTVRRSFPVRIVRPPAKPRPGRYSSKDGDVTFRITGGKKPKVKEFRIFAQTRCGGYLEIPRYTMNYYDFPTTRIGGGGIVDRGQTAELYVVSLELKAIGRKVTEGGFSYGARGAPCSASETFDARRIGR